MSPGLRPYLKPLLFVLLVVSLYGLLRLNRDELVDFVVPLRAADRFVEGEPLYRSDDGHYQYKYFPAFAFLIVPFTWLPKELAEFTWFALTVAMAWALLQWSFDALPARRNSERLLLWVTLFINGKFLVKELAFGQFNLLTALFLLGAVVAAQQRRGTAAGAAIAAATVVKPYGLILVPWLAWTLGWRALAVCALLLAGGLLLPALFYGWQGNLTLLSEWYRTVTDTTAPNLLGAENISFASMWAKWLGPGPWATSLATASLACAIAATGVVMLVRRRVAEPHYLEGAFLFLLVPLLSPQGWDYTLVIAMPAYMLLVDRFRELSVPWRALAVAGIVLTSFSIFDLFGRTLYMALVRHGGITVGAVVIAACIMRLRWQGAA